MKYQLFISKIENGQIKAVNINTMTEPLAVMRKLAECYREANQKTRKNEKITKAKAWETFTPDGLKSQKFSFDLTYDELNKYNYEFTFTGCGLD